MDEQLEKEDTTTKADKWGEAFKRLSTAVTALKVPKSQYNQYGKYHYRSLEDILGAAKPLLMQYGFVFSITDDIVMRGERYYVKAMAKVFDCKTGLCVAESYGYAREPDGKKGMDESQLTGAASTYARKYALCGLLSISEGSELDAMPPNESSPQPKQEQPKTPPQYAAYGDEEQVIMRMIDEYCDETGFNVSYEDFVKTLFPQHYDLNQMNYILSDFDMCMTEYWKRKKAANGTNG